MELKPEIPRPTPPLSVDGGLEWEAVQAETWEDGHVAGGQPGKERAGESPQSAAPWEQGEDGGVSGRQGGQKCQEIRGLSLILSWEERSCWHLRSLRKVAAVCASWQRPWVGRPCLYLCETVDKSLPSVSSSAWAPEGSLLLSWLCKLCQKMPVCH